MSYCVPFSPADVRIEWRNEGWRWHHDDVDPSPSQPEPGKPVPPCGPTRVPPQHGGPGPPLLPGKVLRQHAATASNGGDADLVTNTQQKDEWFV